MEHGETFPSNRHSAKFTLNCASQGGSHKHLEAQSQPSRNVKAAEFQSRVLAAVWGAGFTFLP